MYLSERSDMEQLQNDGMQYKSRARRMMYDEVSLSGDVAWLLGYELNKRKRVEGIVETKQSYMITFRKAEGKWKEVAVCLT